jgi:hypothetical protein
MFPRYQVFKVLKHVREQDSQHILGAVTSSEKRPMKRPERLRENVLENEIASLYLLLDSGVRFLMRVGCERRNI